MIQYESIKEFVTQTEKALSYPLPSVRQHKIKNVITSYQDLFDFFVSISLQTKKYNISFYYNDKTEFTFSKDIGKVVYALVEDDKSLLQTVVSHLPYYVQKLIFMVTSKYFTDKLTEDFLYLNMDTYYKLSDIINYVELPEVILNNTFSFQRIKREGISSFNFPVLLATLPYKSKKRNLVYFTKNGSNIVSNISSSKIRNLITECIPHYSYGLIGVITRAKGYKRKYVFTILYFNTDITNVIDYYRGKPTVYSNNVDSLKINIDEIIIASPKKIESKEEFVALLKKQKSNKKYVLMTEVSLEVITTDIKYDYAKCLDYIYNEEYEAIGLVIKYNNDIYKIYFNVMESIYVDGIKDRFVKIGVSHYKNTIISIFYNAEVKDWHKNYSSCVLCGSVRSKHKTKGLCNVCYSKVYAFTEKLSGYHEEKCDKIFEVYINDFTITADGKTIKFIPDKYKQLLLPLWGDDYFCNK